jgi:nitrate/TMAO reductase-like tetraheme cytochrome c subunit
LPDLPLPQPEGWIGTTSQWTQGLGLVFALFEVIALYWVWRRLRASGLTPDTRTFLALVLVPIPLVVVFFSFSHGLAASKSVNACGACHVMTPWVNDLRDPKSETLAATHFKNRYIQTEQCYTCHSDYGMAGSLKAKIEGLGHVVHNTTGSYPKPIRIARPFPNTRCLSCHGESQKFLKSDGHPPEDMPKLISGENSCIDCHGPAHPGQS